MCHHLSEKLGVTSLDTHHGTPRVLPSLTGQHALPTKQTSACFLALSAKGQHAEVIFLIV